MYNIRPPHGTVAPTSVRGHDPMIQIVHDCSNVPPLPPPSGAHPISDIPGPRPTTLGQGRPLLRVENLTPDSDFVALRKNKFAQNLFDETEKGWQRRIKWQ